MATCRHGRRLMLAGLAPLIVAACASGQTSRPGPLNSTTQLESGLIYGAACDFGDVSFNAAFESGRLNGCVQDGERAFTLFIRPEDAPINPSSWFAFEMRSEIAAPLTLTLSYDHGAHRYVPKVSVDGGATWREVDAVATTDGGRRARFTIEAQAGAVLVAAQPLYQQSDHQAWMTQIAARDGVTRAMFGRSEQGRPLEVLTFGAADADLITIIGGQHPPETRGATALAAFVERLLETDALAEAFRARYRVAAAPLLNPDGSVAGNWRHNSRGVDLNRDWGRFTQAETRAFSSWLNSAGRPVAFFDFHGTGVDILYTTPLDAPDGTGLLARNLHQELVAQLGDGAPAIAPSFGPRTGVAKNWFNEHYAIPAVTYEVGDETPLDVTRANARLSAEITMRLFLNEETVAPPALEASSR